VEPVSAPNAPDAVVVGGGAVGCATAYELTRRGLRVSLVERDGIASHASGFAYGGLYATTGAGIPGPVLPVAKQCLELHRGLADDIRDQTGLDDGFRPARSIEVAFDQRRVDWLKGEARWQLQEGFKVELLDQKGMREIEPRLNPDIIGGALHSSHYEVDSYKYTFGLGWAFEKRGGRIVRSSAVAVTERDGRATGVALSNGETIPAGIVVLATGPWASTDEIPGVRPLPIHASRGEILRLEFPGDDFRSRVTLDSHYIARKPDGLVWVGTTDETVPGFDDRTTEAARASIMEGVLRLAPALEAARLVTQTACLRPVAKDGLPIIGRGGLDGLYLANGAGKKGILLSPAIARMVAALAIDADEAAVPAPFRSGRFAIR